MTQPRLRRDLNIITGMGLPSWSMGPHGDYAAIIAAAKAAGYEGVQHFVPAHVRAAGLRATGMGRVLTLDDADNITRMHKAAGSEATTLHVGTGLESDLEMDRLAAAVLDASAKHSYPLYVETHRATITQDMRRTVDLVGRFPELRFNADLSHYYCGQELAYGDIAAKFDFLQPVFERVRFLHGRLADGGAAQAMIFKDDERPFIAHFREMWRRCFRAFKAQAEPGAELPFAIELLPYAIDADGTRHWIYYARQAMRDGTWQEECDRWTQADLIWDLARACFDG